MVTCPNSLQSLLLSSSSHLFCSASAGAGAFVAGTGIGIGAAAAAVTKLSSTRSNAASALLLPVLASFILCPDTIDEVEGIITNISLIQTWRWFFALTKFEAVFLGLIMLQICMLQYLGILPLNINQYLYGMSSGRKRRRRRSIANSTAKEVLNEYEKNHRSYEPGFDYDPILIEKMLGTLYQMDRQKCALRVMCELQSWYLTTQKSQKTETNVENKSKHRKHEQRRLPKSLELTLEVFSINHRKRREFHPPNSTLHKPETISSGFNTTITQLFEDAVERGRLTSVAEAAASILTLDPQRLDVDRSNSNSTMAGSLNYCVKYYGDCDLTIDEILGYAEDMRFNDIF